VSAWVWILVVSTIGTSPNNAERGKFTTKQECLQALKTIQLQEKKVVGRCELRQQIK
jgi:hypothetical protein